MASDDNPGSEWAISDWSSKRPWAYVPKSSKLKSAVALTC